MEPLLTCNSCSIPCEKSCKNCAKVSYCSQDCQKKDWPSHKGQCYPAEIVIESSGLSFLIATKDVAEGSLLLTDWPLVYGPHSIKNGVLICLGCCKVMGDGNKCPNCGWPLCNDNCEMKTLHTSNECSILSSTLINFSDVPLDYNMIRVIRILLVFLRDPVKMQHFLNLRFKKRKMDPNSTQTRQRSLVLKVLRCIAVFEKLDDQLMERVYDIHEQNGRSLVKETGKSESLVYTFNGKIGHSCIPNTQTEEIFDKKPPKRTTSYPFRGMSFIATKGIKKGEKLSQSLIVSNVFEGSVARRAVLRKGGLNCHCPRCLDPTELGTYLSALKCSSFTCKGNVLPLNPIDFESKWQCSDCSGNISKETVDSILGPITKKASLLQEEAESRGFYSFSFAIRDFVSEDFHCMAKMEKFLDKYDKVLHPNHYLIHQVKSLLLMAHHVYFMRPREFTKNVEVRETRLRLLDRYEDLAKYCLNIGNVILSRRSEFRMRILYLLGTSQWLKFAELVTADGNMKTQKSSVKQAIEATNEVEDVAKSSPRNSATQVFANLLLKQKNFFQRCVENELADEMGQLFL